MADGARELKGGLVRGHDPRVLDPSTDRLFADALLASPCKLMTRGPEGEHLEVALPEGYAAPPQATRCYMNLEARAPSLPERLRPSGARLSLVDPVNAYVSAPGCGAPLHFDTRTVCIVQLFGTKVWMVSREPAVADPAHNLVAPAGRAWADYDGRALPVPDDLIPCMLRPGDWLEVPRGAWHRTLTATGSVSATLAAPEHHPAGKDSP